MVVSGQNPFIEVNAQKTRLLNVTTRIPPTGGTFSSYVQVDNDQSFLLDGLDTALATGSSNYGVLCNATVCNPVVYAPGPFSTNAAVGWLKHLNISMQCSGNGVDWQSGNSVKISDSVIQGFAQYGVRAGVKRGGYSGFELDNVYEEVGSCTNPAGAIGEAGVIAQGATVKVGGAVLPTGSVPQFANTGSTDYRYYIVANNLTFGGSNPLYAGTALTNGSGNITVTTPDIAGATTFDLLRVTYLPLNNPREQAPYGTGNYAVAKNVTRASACANGVCTFTDTQATLQSYTVGLPTYFPLLDFWPGNLILAANKDSGSVLDAAIAWMQSAPRNIVGVQGTGGPAVISTSCDSISGWTPLWLSCYTSMAPGVFSEQGAFLLAVKPNQDGGLRTNLKGRLNFPTLGSAPGHIITLSDSNFQKTIATANNRPTNDANDAFVGYDQGDGNPAHIGISLGAPVSLSDYIGNAGDGTNWLERLTSGLKEFKTSVQLDNTLTVAGTTQASSFFSTGAGSWAVEGSYGTLSPALSGKSAIGFGASGKLQVSENGGAVVEVAKLDGGGNVAENANTATQLAQPPTQCNGSFATGVQANGNANCSIADAVQLAETTPPAGIPNYGIFWFDSTCHCPKVISNNGQPVQLGLLNVFNTDANTLEEYNGASPQVLNVYGARTDPSNYERMRLGYDTTDGYFLIGADAAGTGAQRGLGLWMQGSLRWVVDPSFNFKPWSDNIKDIGSPTLRPKHVYAGTYADLTSGSLVTDIPNQGTTGTILNKLAKVTGSPATAITASISDINGVIGIVVDGAGTTGSAQIARGGQASCVFDGATTTGDYVQISSTTAGSCHDVGATYPGAGQVLGRVLSTNASAGTYVMLASGAEVQAPAAGNVNTVFGRNGTISAQMGDYTAAQVTGAATLSSPAFTGTPTAPTPAAGDNSTAIATTAFVNGQGGVPAGTFTVTTGMCPAANDSCITPLIADNTTVHVVGPGTFTVNPSGGIRITNVQNGALICDPGVKFVPPATGNSSQLFLVNGGTTNFRIEGCEVSGYAFNSGTIAVSNGSTAATLSTAVSANLQTFIGNHADQAWLTVCSAVLNNGIADPSPNHCQGTTINASSGGTSLTLTSSWVGQTCTNCTFQIGYGTQYGMVVTDSVYTIGGGGNIGCASSCGTSTSVVTVTLPAGDKASLTSGQQVTIYGTGTLGAQSALGTYGSYNNLQTPPITVVSGCDGTASAPCVLTYLSTQNLGIATTGKVAIGPSYVTFDHLHVHHITAQGIALATDVSDPGDFSHNNAVQNSIVHDCGTGCIVASRTYAAKLLNNTVWANGATGGGGAGVDAQSSSYPTIQFNDVAPLNNGSPAIHGVFLWGGDYTGNRVHDSPNPNSNVQTSKNIGIHVDSGFNVAVVGGTISQGGASPNQSAPITGGPGIRLEVDKGSSVTGVAINNVGGAGILVNSRLENAGDFPAASGLASCAVNTNCGTPAGHQIHPFDAANALSALSTFSLISGGTNTALKITPGAPALKDGTGCAGTPSGTAAFDCVADAAVKQEGTGSLEVCPDDGTHHGCTSPAAVFNSGCTTFESCIVWYMNFPCSASALCNGGGNSNLLTLPIWRMWIASPATQAILAGDFRIGWSSQPNCVAPESQMDIPKIPSNQWARLEFTPPNWMSWMDNPGIECIAIASKAGGTTASYSNLHFDDLAIDIPDLQGDNVVTGNNIYHAQGGGVVSFGGTSGFNIVGNTCIDPGWGTGNNGGGNYCYWIENGLNGAANAIPGIPLVGGNVGLNFGYQTANFNGSTCIGLKTEQGGTIDQVHADASGCPTAQWAKTLDPTSATNFGLASPTLTGTVTLPITGSTQCLHVNSLGVVTGTGSDCGSGGGSVTSVFGRSGAVTATSGDYSVGQVTGAAGLASPAFTGTPSAPTTATGDNSTNLATTAFVKAQGYLTSVPTCPMWLTQPHASSTVSFSSTANRASLWGVVINCTLATTQVTYDVSTADNTANTYDLGIVNSSGTVVAHIGSTAGTSFAPSAGWKTLNWAAAATLPPGKYYLAITSSCTSSCAVLQGGSSGVGFTFAGNQLENVTTGGTLPGTITTPSDAYTATTIPVWSVH
jgi:hypothetical protein